VLRPFLRRRDERQVDLRGHRRRELDLRLLRRFAGRDATAAEIDRLAEWLLDEVGEVSIISEERHEIDANVEASVHQVRIEVAADRVPGDPVERAAIEARIVERAEYWANLCVAERHVETPTAFKEPV
jgi:hypothetical protein